MPLITATSALQSWTRNSFNKTAVLRECFPSKILRVIIDLYMNSFRYFFDSNREYAESYKSRTNEFDSTISRESSSFTIRTKVTERPLRANSRNTVGENNLDATESC